MPDDTDESATITDTAMDYLESYATRDPIHMERTLHPQLVRDVVIPDGAPSWHDVPGDYLYRVSAHTLLQLVARPVDPIPATERTAEVTLLDRAATAASVRIDAGPWMEYLHLCKWNGRWLILNAVRVSGMDQTRR
jgi:hypothetical protein